MVRRSDSRPTTPPNRRGNRGIGNMTAAGSTRDFVLDLRGLRCPQPVLRAKKALRNVPIGGVLVLQCTDPLTVIDIPHFARQTGHELTDQSRCGNLFIFKLIKRC
jgi:tRNA 2-thiouridine synthesizing protein A